MWWLKPFFLLLSQKIFCAITFILCFCIEIELTSMMVSRKSGIGSKKFFMKQGNHGDCPRDSCVRRQGRGIVKSCNKVRESVLFVGIFFVFLRRKSKVILPMNTRKKEGGVSIKMTHLPFVWKRYDVSGLKRICAMWRERHHCQQTVP